MAAAETLLVLDPPRDGPDEQRAVARNAAMVMGVCLLASGVLSPDGTRDFELTDRGLRFLEELGLDAEPILRSRRMLARDCLDWTERKPHLAGGLPAALLARFVELGWLDRRRNDRGLTITNLGHANLPALGQPSTTPGLLVRASR